MWCAWQVGNRMLAKARRGISQVCLEVRCLRIRMMRTAHRTHIYIRAYIQYQQLSNPLTGRADRLPPTLHDHHTLLTFCEFQQAHAYCIAPYVPMTHVLTASRRLSTHACTAHETSMHMPHVTSYFIINPQHPLSGRPPQFVHIIPAFISSNTLTGRTGRLHIFKTLVPSYRAQHRCSFRADRLHIFQTPAPCHRAQVFS